MSIIPNVGIQDFLVKHQDIKVYDSGSVLVAAAAATQVGLYGTQYLSFQLFSRIFGFHLDDSI